MPQTSTPTTASKPAQNPTVCDTMGWDTVFAIPVSKVNASIQKCKSSPVKFSFTSADGDTITGRFDDWQIVPGGDGQLVWLSIPVKDASGKLNSLDNQMGDYTWSQGSLVIEVRLQYLPIVKPAAPLAAAQPAQAADPSPNRDAIQPTHELKVRHKSPDPKDPVVSVKKVNWISEPAGPVVDEFDATTAEAMIESLISGWLNAHLDEFNHVFASVDLNEIIDKDAAWAWTKPTLVDYAYCNGDSVETSALGVLCMTAGRDASKCTRQLDRNVIPRGSVAGYLISQQRLLENVLMPVLPLYWTNSTPEDYEVAGLGDPKSGNYEIVLRLKENSAIQLAPVKSGLQWFTPVMKEMTIAVQGSQLTFSACTEVTVQFDLTVICNTTHSYTIQLGPDGKTLVYQSAGDPTVTYEAKEGSNTALYRELVLIIGAMISALIISFTEGWGTVVGFAIVALVVGMAALAPTITKAVVSDYAPTLDLAAFNVAAPIRWNSSADFKLTSATLNGALQLGGDPQFA